MGGGQLTIGANVNPVQFKNILVGGGGLRFQGATVKDPASAAGSFCRQRAGATDRGVLLLFSSG